MTNVTQMVIRRGDSTSGSWEIYQPEHNALFGTSWIPLPLRASANEQRVKDHVISCFGNVDVLVI